MILSQTTLAGSLINREAPLANTVWTTLATFVHGGVVLFVRAWNHHLSKIALTFFVSITALALIYHLSLYVRMFFRRDNNDSNRTSSYTAFWMLFGGALGAHFVAIAGSFFFPAQGFPEYNVFPKEGRTWFIQVVLLLLTLWTIVSKVKASPQVKTKRENFKNYVLPLSFLIIGITGAPFMFSQSELRSETNEKNFSNWKAFAPQIDDGFGCVTLNPYPWFYGQNCRILSPIYDQAAYQNNLIEGEQVSIVIPEEYREKKIRYIGFYVSDLGRAERSNYILDAQKSGNSDSRFEKKSLVRNKSPYVFFLIEPNEMPLLGGATLSLKNADGKAFTVGVPEVGKASTAALLFGQ